MNENESIVIYQTGTSLVGKLDNPSKLKLRQRCYPIINDTPFNYIIENGLIGRKGYRAGDIHENSLPSTGQEIKIAIMGDLNFRNLYKDEEKGLVNLIAEVCLTRGLPPSKISKGDHPTYTPGRNFNTEDLVRKVENRMSEIQRYELERIKEESKEKRQENIDTINYARKVNGLNDLFKDSKNPELN